MLGADALLECEPTSVALVMQGGGGVWVPQPFLRHRVRQMLCWPMGSGVAVTHSSHPAGTGFLVTYPLLTAW